VEHENKTISDCHVHSINSSRLSKDCASDDTHRLVQYKCMLTALMQESGAGSVYICVVVQTAVAGKNLAAVSSTVNSDQTSSVVDSE